MFQTEYNCFKFEITEIFDANANMVQLANFNFKYENNDIDMSKCKLYNLNGRSPWNEQVNNLIDGDCDTKFLDFNFNKYNKSDVIFKFENNVSIDAYELCTANDCQERDPKSWNLYGSSDNNKWVLLDSQTISQTYDRFTKMGPYDLELTRITPEDNFMSEQEKKS